MYSRIQELIISNERLKAQLSENEKKNKPDEETPQAESKSRDVQKETEILHSKLRDIAQAVINDDQMFSIDDRLSSAVGGSVSPRSRSPIRRVGNNSSRPSSRTGSPFADATFSAVQAALNKRQLQVIFDSQLNRNIVCTFFFFNEKIYLVIDP